MRSEMNAEARKAWSRSVEEQFVGEAPQDDCWKRVFALAA